MSWSLRNTQKNGKLRKNFFLLAICLLVADAAFFSLAPLPLLFPPPAQDVEKADVGAILFQDFSGNPSGISDETARRINHGITLFRDGKLRHLFMTGGSRPEQSQSGAELMAEYARQAGIPARAVSTDSGSRDSTSNLANIHKTAATREWQQMLLISSPPHLARISRMGLLEQTLSCTLAPYNPSRCQPGLTRYEIWYSVHYNLVAELLWRLMPEAVYDQFVNWMRTHTAF